MTVELKWRPISRLIPAFRNWQTQECYLIKLRMFFEFCDLGPDEFVAIARSDQGRAEELVTSCILAGREKISGSTIHCFRVALKLLLAMNDCDKLNWVQDQEPVGKSWVDEVLTTPRFPAGGSLGCC